MGWCPAMSRGDLRPSITAGSPQHLTSACRRSTSPAAPLAAPALHSPASPHFPETRPGAWSPTLSPESWEYHLRHSPALSASCPSPRPTGARVTYLPPRGSLILSQHPSFLLLLPPGKPRSIVHTVLDRTFQKETLNQACTSLPIFEGHKGHLGIQPQQATPLQAHGQPVVLASAVPLRGIPTPPHTHTTSNTLFTHPLCQHAPGGHHSLPTAGCLRAPGRCPCVVSAATLTSARGSPCGSLPP